MTQQRSGVSELGLIAAILGVVGGVATVATCCYQHHTACIERDTAAAEERTQANARDAAEGQERAARFQLEAAKEERLKAEIDRKRAEAEAAAERTRLQVAQIDARQREASDDERKKSPQLLPSIPTPSVTKPIQNIPIGNPQPQFRSNVPACGNPNCTNPNCPGTKRNRSTAIRLVSG